MLFTIRKKLALSFLLVGLILPVMACGIFCEAANLRALTNRMFSEGAQFTETMQLILDRLALLELYVTLGCLSSILVLVIMGKRFVRAFKRGIKIQADAVTAMAVTKDLTIRAPINANDELSALAKSVNHLTKNIDAVFVTFNNSAETMSNATLELSDTSENLSSYASAQADHAEGLTARIEGVSKTARETAQSVTRSAQHSRDSKEASKIVQKEMDDLNEAMSAIENNSKDIDRVIQAMDSIASKANVIAINAAVEAARAGEEGKGFSVVANEVRVLAQHSSGTVKDVSGTIGRAMQNIQTGAHLVRRVSETLEKLTENNQHIHQMFEEIAEASTDNNNELDEIEHGLRELTSTTQNTACTAEAMVTTSQISHSQVETLRKHLDEFRTSLSSNSRDSR